MGRLYAIFFSRYGIGRRLCLVGKTGGEVEKDYLLFYNRSIIKPSLMKNKTVFQV